MPATFFHPPRLPFVEGRLACDSAACYRPHSHPTFSIGCVDAGSSTLALGDRKMRLRAGDVVLINAGMVHSCNPWPGRSWSYRMLYFDPAWIGLPAHDLEWQTPLRSTRARVAFDAIMAMVASNGADPGAERRLHALVCTLLRGASTGRSGSASHAAPWLEPARDHIVAHCAERLPLRVLARRFGVSAFALVRQFKRRYGLTPHAFQLDQRVVQARQLLRQGVPAAQVAQDLGFADQAHLTRVFKPRVAATPGQYHRHRVTPRSRS
jgi:AraC-like DNA-binding protein